METFINLILQAGHSAVEVVLYTLLPIMVVMMILVRILEVTNLLDRFITFTQPYIKPFGLNGLGVLAMFQISFISFVAPLPTLALMQDRGVSDRNLAATFAAVLAMAPANALFPLTIYGLNLTSVLIISIIGGLVASSTTYWFFGRKLSNTGIQISHYEKEIQKHSSLLKIINASGAEAIRIVINIIPMLLISLLVVLILQNSGAINYLEILITPVLEFFGINPQIILLTLTKYLAGSTALVGLIHDLSKETTNIDAFLNTSSAGFLLHPFDVAGLAILLSAGPRMSKVLIPAIFGAIAGITIRAILGLFF
ncbi:nucleoside recognition family protein [Acinetobacter sp. GN11]